jgi:plastocyanin
MLLFEKIAPLLAGLAMLVPIAAEADMIEVRTVGVKFVPDIIHARVGDVIAFRDMPTHFVETVEGMWPEGAPKMLSVMGADYDYPLVREGLYVFKCPPHWGARMGGVIQVCPIEGLDGTLEKYFRVAETVKEARPAKSLLSKFRDEILR